MFCPKCKYEYKEEITKCPDCDEWLVKQLDVDQEEAKEYKDWVQLARINSDQQATMLVDALRQKDIPAVLHSGTGYFGKVVHLSKGRAECGAEGN